MVKGTVKNYFEILGVQITVEVKPTTPFMHKLLKTDKPNEQLWDIIIFKKHK